MCVEMFDEMEPVVTEAKVDNLIGPIGKCGEDQEKGKVADS